MASGHSSDPKLLYAINGVSAFHIANGKEEPLTPASPQTLSLLMVPANSPFADPNFDTKDDTTDFYLHINLPPELDMPLPATTQIYHQPPNSYLIPRWDLGPNSGAFTRLTFPPIGSRPGLQEDIDTFETILAQCTSFLERAPPPETSGKGKEQEAYAKKSSLSSPKSKMPRSPSSVSSSPSSSSKLKSKSAAMTTEAPPPAYNPADFSPGEAYVRGSQGYSHGEIVLVDEENGSVIGELGETYQVVEDKDVKPGSKEPVQITLPSDGSNTVTVGTAPPEALEMDLHPAYRKSFLVSKAHYASRLIITASDRLSQGMQSGADTFTTKTKPVETAVTFKPATHDRVRQIGRLSGEVANLSSKTVGQVTKVAQNIGAGLARKKERPSHGLRGGPGDDFKPGLLNKSLMAFSTITDGMEQASRNLLNSTSQAATSMVTHRWGAEAGEMSKHLGGSAKNVGLVYIDVTGVSRRAVVKAVGKGMVVGKVKGGGQIIVGEDDTRDQGNRSSNHSTADLVGDDTASVSGVSGKSCSKRTSPRSGGKVYG